MKRFATALLATLISVPSPGVLAHDVPACASYRIAPGQVTVTPARITGASNEKVDLRSFHPDGAEQVSLDTSPRQGYLLPGDDVDLITQCAGYSYVRFHGARRVSTGWVKTSDVQVVGAPHVPLPANAVALCHAAGEALNRGHGERWLPLVPTTPLPDEAATRLQIGGHGLSQVAHVTVEGRALALVNEDGGGTCHSSEVSVFTGDLSSRLSPPDTLDRNPANDGGEHWSFGTLQEVVEVEGQPMVATYTMDRSRFFLSVIGRDGDMQVTCEGRLRNLPRRRIESSSEGAVCQAFLSGAETPVPMHAPAPGESLAFSLPSPELAPADVPRSSNGTTLYFHSRGLAPEASFVLAQTGVADLDNRGRERRIAIVYYDAVGSSAGCGTYSEHRVEPVFLDPRGVADPSLPHSRSIGDALPGGMSGMRLARLAGTTYIELSPGRSGPGSEIWRIDRSGAHRVCKFQWQGYQVKPITAGSYGRSW